MASSSSKQASGSSDFSLQIKPKTMAILLESFEVQVESPVDFASLKRNGMNLEAEIVAQEMFPYFEMLNGPTYVMLVKDFWVRAEVYDVDAAKDEELRAVIKDPSLRGKTRKEMGLESFRQTEIRSTVMGIPITITEEVIAKACRVTTTGRFIWNANRNNPLLDSYKGVVLKGNSSTKLVDIDGHHRMLLKFTKLMKDFPPIYQERNPEVLAKLIADFVKESDIRRRAPEDTSSEARSSEATVIRSISPEATSPELTKYNVRSVQPRTLQPPSLQLCFHIKTRITITLLQTLFLFKWNRFEISSSKDKYQIRQKINGEESKLHARQVDVTTKFSTSLKSSINRDEDLENKY